MTNTRQTLKATQILTIKTHLLEGRTISTWQAYQNYNITCLAQRIHDLRNEGLPVESEIVSREGKRFSLYWLDTDYLNRRTEAPLQVLEGA